MYTSQKSESRAHIACVEHRYLRWEVYGFPFLGEDSKHCSLSTHGLGLGGPVQ